MDDRQSSYFSTGPTPIKETGFALRQPSAKDHPSRIDKTSITGNVSRADNNSEPGHSSRTGNISRTENSSRFGQASRNENVSIVEPVKTLEQDSTVQRHVKDTQIPELEEDIEIKVNSKSRKRTTKSQTQQNGVRLAQIYRKRPLYQHEETKREPKVEEVPERKKQLTYPIPKPPPTRKADIFKLEGAKEIDKEVLKVDIEAYPDVKSLTKKITVNYYKDVDKVRSIFAWICSQELNNLDYSRAINEQTPLHAVKKVKDGTTTYSELFEIMCKCVDIPCHVVTGIAKLENHDIGETEIDKNRVTWNAVYVADGWRIVFFQWAFDTFREEKETSRQYPSETLRAVSKTKTSSFKETEKEHHENGDSSIPTLPSISNSSSFKESISTKGYHTSKTITPILGSKREYSENVLKINEYYFLTDPDEFIFRCFPDEDMWQLLGKPYTIEKFLKLPFLSQSFFDHHLKISSRLSGIRKAKKGFCIISIKRMVSRNVFLKHSLELVDSESPDKTLDIDLKYLVAVVHEENKTHFQISLPVAGMYDFKIFGGMTEVDLNFLCSFKINCEEPKTRLEPLPFVPEIGFGPCLVTDRFGMKLVSNVTGTVIIRGPDTVDIDFKLLKDIKVMAEMLHQTIPPSELDDFISLKQHKDDLFITVGVPRNGEYVLKLLAKFRRSKKDFINVCNFLLMPEDPKKPRKVYETAGELMIRQQLLHTLKNSKNPDDVQMAIDRLNKEDLPDDGWLTKAYERLDYLKLARALRNGINRRNAEILEKAIQNAKQSNQREKLQNYIIEGERMLKDAANNPIYILDMKRTTVSEVHRYKIPKPVMYDVMKATYLLLGEDEESLSTWEEIVYLMRMTSKNSLLYRVKHFNKKTVNEETIQIVNSLLKDHSLEEARLASSGVGTFYLWAGDIAKTISKSKKKTTAPPKESQTSDNATDDNDENRTKN